MTSDTKEIKAHVERGGWLTNKLARALIDGLDSEPSPEQLAYAKREALDAWHALAKDRFKTENSREAMDSIHETLVTLGVVHDGTMPMPCACHPDCICYLRRCSQAQRCRHA